MTKTIAMTEQKIPLPERTLEKYDFKSPPVTLSLDQDSPFESPTKHSKHILIVGGGVSGLMTAWILLDKGYRITIISKE